MHVVRKSYQGRHSLEGNQCSTFLNKVDYLEREVMKLPSDKLISALPVVETFRAFRKVKESCFGVDLKGNYRETIENFSRSYRALEATVTPKVKCLFDFSLYIFFKPGPYG